MDIESIEIENNIKMLELINYTESFIEKNYLLEKEAYEILEVSSEIQNIDFSQDIRIMLLDRFVYDKKENCLNKLENIFTALYGNDTSVFFLLDSDGKKCDFYIGVKDTKDVVQGFTILEASLNGNFPGIATKEKITSSKLTKIMEKVTGDDIFEISAVSGIPSLKSEDENNFVQGIERLIDGMEGKEFSAIIIADPIANNVIKKSKKAYESLYTQLYPFLSTNISLSKSEAQTLSEGWSKTFTENYSKTMSATETTNTSITNGHNEGETTSTNGMNYLEIASPLIGLGAGYLFGGPLVGIIGGNAVGKKIGSKIGGTISQVAGTLVGFGMNKIKPNSKVTKSVNAVGGAEVGKIIGQKASYAASGYGSSKTKGKSYSETEGTSNSVTEAHNSGNSNSESTNETNTETLTNGKTFQIINKNKTIENLLKKIEQSIERLNHAEGNGMWSVGTYFLSKNLQDSTIAANLYNGLIRGNKSNLEKCGVYNFREKNEIEALKDYLFNFSLPLIKLKSEDLDVITPMGSLVSNKELPLKMNFPRNSVAGLEVIEMSSFGRNQKIISTENSINLGYNYHLGNTSKLESRLNIESLSSHTFVAGSTGSGKSNVIYTLLNELYQKNIKFMVVEPAKGEYKNVFGGWKNIEVYGTNKKYTKLLKINPFSFSDEIHVLEHIDRLIEIFNACWPMYAAMPAILKEAVEMAYVIKGWDLDTSINMYGKREFPTFKMLKDSLEEIITKSSYSDESKSNYKGALVTRVNSLCNGLLGKIFDNDEIEDEKLFDENVIIDLSRIPSAETKSLVMGILFVKLQEFRTSSANQHNEKLKHVTVIEEAHNLLRKTSISQSQEGSNLQGKSIEMMTNAIAEMRTYGEGFIIADQAPGLLDEAVIRNTNTKICLRLPSKDDREIVGKSMKLDEEQINELSRLETGVAAVYQNNWNETCLVKINYMDRKYKYIYNPEKEDRDQLKNIFKILLEKKLPKVEKLDENFRAESIDLIKSKKIDIENMNNQEIDRAIFENLEGDKILNIVNAVKSKDIQEWSEKIQNILTYILNLNEKEVFLKIEIANSIVRENALRNPEYLEFYKQWNEFLKEGTFI